MEAGSLWQQALINLRWKFAHGPDLEKLRLVDAILSDLEKPDPEIDGIWAEEAKKRWAAYKAVEFPR